MKKHLGNLLGIGALFLLISYSQITYAFDEASGTDIRSISLGGIHSLSNELLNPASISFREKREIGIFAVNRFDIKELSTRGVYGIFPNKRLDIGTKFTFYGYEDYYLIRGEINLAKKIASGIAIGVQFACLYEDSFLKDQTETFFQADPGIFWIVNSKIELAFITKNAISTYNRSIVDFYSGMSYKPFLKFQIQIEGGFNLSQFSHLSIGTEYELSQELAIRFGCRTDAPNPSIGASWKWNQWKIEAVFLLHDLLDLSSGIKISYSL